MEKSHEGALCGWCGKEPTEQGNEHCSIDCYHHAHDTGFLLQVAVNDRSILRGTSKRLATEIAELACSLERNGSCGSHHHPEIQASLTRMKADLEQVNVQIENISSRIQELELLLN